MLWNLIVAGLLVTGASEPSPKATAQAGAIDRARICPSVDDIPVSLIGMSEYFRKTVYMNVEAEHTRELCLADLDTVPASAQNLGAGVASGSPDAAQAANGNFLSRGWCAMKERISQMFNAGKTEEEWSRGGWSTQPSHLTYDRISGGLE